MHQSGPNSHGSTQAAAATGQDVPPRWAFLVAYDPVHNARLRQPHPHLARRRQHPGRPDERARPRAGRLDRAILRPELDVPRTVRLGGKARTLTLRAGTPITLSLKDFA